MAQNNRNGHIQNGSTPSSPSLSMSNGQQQSVQSRQQAQQPVSYPSPTSYPSPSLSNAQYNYPPPNQQGSEPYRASPTGSTGSLSLPSMRSLDPLQQQQQQQHANMSSNLPPPVAQMGGGPYYHNQGQTLPHPSHQYPNVTSDPTGQNMRYALPVTDSRVMSGGRHKKEIKRRTKTGCLTCRKRRIKCDEQHPACRNCQKSKRDCLGYDPIFKQQPGPAAIQPAPSSAPSAGGIAATSHPYGHQPQIMTGYGAPTSMNNFDPALSAGASSPGSASQQFDYASAIDPALEGVGPSASTSTSAAAAPIPAPASAPTYAPPAYPTSAPAKRTVEHLLDMGGPPPPRALTDVTTSPNMLDEIKHLYYSIYAPGLENFLESKWFSVKGLQKLLAGKALLDAFGSLLHQFSKTAQNDPKEIAYTSSVEARTVWALAAMVRQAAGEMNGTREYKTVPSNDDPVEATNRLNIFETLITGRVAAANPLTQPVAGSTDHHRLRELEFWHSLGKFVTLDYEDDNAAKTVDDCLATLRNLLDGRENRDVLYSIAVARGLGHRVSEYTEFTQPLHLDESDNKSKLVVAKKFVQDEANGSGTTNVIRRLCDLAARSWAPSGPTGSN
ncbi:uncharacterized protein LY89DRAFT_691268 [Mollisia scopiformis]|uniref:Zn(2)-C6 fungal-type domain-containing protein n=1 Tax=Mollisia scopiformis TaxID=149040 RepID=A0A132B6C5_MOLSC|nr:uncharacterized protein LY89DRAFT_691268 [Mollisia scopiformis]KUJ07952.1 hypothetical protein LY89DRAFT_691268 [Mollisia scopiformis]